MHWIVWIHLEYLKHQIKAADQQAGNDHLR